MRAETLARLWILTAGLMFAEGFVRGVVDFCLANKSHLIPVVVQAALFMYRI